MAVRFTLGQRMQLQFAMVALLPLLVVGAMILFWLLPQMLDEIKFHHQEKAQAVANQVMYRLNGAERELHPLAEHLAQFNLDSMVTPGSLLDAHLQVSDLFDALYIADAAGFISTVGLPPDKDARRNDYLGMDLSRRPFMQKLRATHQPMWSDTFLSSVSGKIGVAYIIPMGNWYLFGEVSVDRLTSLITDIPSESRLVTLVLDSRDRVIAYSEWAFAGQYINLKRMSISRHLPTAGPQSRSFQMEGKDYLGTVVNVSRFGWRVLVAESWEDASKPLKFTLWTLGGGLFSALLLAVVAGWLIARKASRNFARFNSQAQSIANGDYDQPWPIPRTKELERLANTMQFMANSIRKREDELAASEARYRSVVANAPVVLMQFDLQGIITLNEGKSLTKLGLEAGDYYGRSVLELFKESPKVCDNARRAMDGQPTQFTARFRANEFEIYFVPVSEEGVNPYVLGIMVDVTMRRRAEKALAASERLLRESQAVARLGHYSYDLKKDVWERSAILDDIMGLNANFTKSGQGWLELVHPDERQEVRALVRQTLDKGVPFNREYRIVRQVDKQERWVHGLGRLDSDTQGRPIRLIGTIQDITDHKELENQLLQSQKMQAIGQLAGGVAHDFNNMLSVILGYTDLMRLALPRDSEEYEQLVEIERAANHSRDITRQLLAFSRKQIIMPHSQDLNKLVESSVKTLVRLIGENITLEFKPAADPWLVKVDDTQIDQILVNLAVNGRDAMPAGGSLVLETENVVFDEEYCRRHLGFIPGNFVMLAVSDTGQGMDKQTMARIFEPFFTTKGVGKGTGLGLATVYGIVKQNKGFINVYSEPDQGTTFRIYLPRSTEMDEVAQTTAPAKPGEGTGSVLLVEDDEMVRRTTASMLRKLGYTVTAPESPSDAVSLCRQSGQKFDLLITDVIMPEMSGKDLRDQVMAGQPDITVLFISGYTSEVIVHHGVLETGVNFLAKPFTLDVLAAKLREVLGGQPQE